MAAITRTQVTDGLSLVRQAATTSQTDWLVVPPWAKSAYVYLSITTAGTNTILTLHAADPVLADDAQSIVLFTGATITAATNHLYILGSDASQVTATETADSATLDAVVTDNELRVLPPLFGVQVAATGSTYTLSVFFKRV